MVRNNYLNLNLPFNNIINSQIKKFKSKKILQLRIHKDFIEIDTNNKVSKLKETIFNFCLRKKLHNFIN